MPSGCLPMWVLSGSFDICVVLVFYRVFMWVYCYIVLVQYRGLVKSFVIFIGAIFNVSCTKVYVWCFL